MQTQWYDLLPKLLTWCVLQRQPWDFAGIALLLKISNTVLLLFNSMWNRIYTPKLLLSTRNHTSF